MIVKMEIKIFVVKEKGRRLIKFLIVLRLANTHTITHFFGSNQNYNSNKNSLLFKDSFTLLNAIALTINLFSFCLHNY